jgi:hypothetical protein
MQTLKSDLKIGEYGLQCVSPKDDLRFPQRRERTICLWSSA